jgi:hypothetical protein
MNQKIQVVILFLFVNLFAFAQNDLLKLGAEISFSSEKYVLTRSGKPYNNYYIQEYIRASENPQNFTKSIVIMAIVDTTTTDHLLSLKIKELDKMKEKGTKVDYKPFINEEEGRMIEYSIYDEVSFQWNIQRFEVQKTKTNKDVGFIFSYVERKKITTEQSLEKIKSLVDEKMIGYVNEVGAITLPKVIIED